MPKKIFICYRRGDAGGYAHDLFSRLKSKFGSRNVTLDVRVIPPGHDFVGILTTSISACDIVLAVVGPDWPAILERRTTKDYVVEEIIAAIAYRKLIIPVLVGNARMPDEGDLPAEIRAFGRCQAVELRGSSYDADFRTLTRAVKRSGPQQGPCRLVSGVLGVALVLTLAGLVYVWMSTRDFSPKFFRTDQNIYASIKEDYYGPKLKGVNVAVERIVYVRYITPEFQIGIHAYLGIKRTPGSGLGWIDVKVASESYLDQKDVDWFQWDGEGAPTLTGTSRMGDNPNQFIVRPGSPSNFAIFKYYDDRVGGGDHFHFTLSGHDVGEGFPIIDNYVVVPRNNLDIFHVNKYLFDIVPCSWCSGGASIGFSSVSFKPVDTSAQQAQPARDLLSRFQLVATCSWDDKRCHDNYLPARREIGAIFSHDSFHSDVAVFHLSTKPRRDMVLLYRFCSEKEGEGCL